MATKKTGGRQSYEPVKKTKHSEEVGWSVYVRVQCVCVCKE